MNKKYIIAILATVIVGGMIFYACQKDESLTTKTEEISSVKEQKIFEGYWETYGQTNLGYDEYGRLCYVSTGGKVFVYIYRGVKKYIMWEGRTTYEPVLYPGFPNNLPRPPYNPPHGNSIISFDFSGTITNEAYQQLSGAGDMSGIFECFENYKIKINGNDLTDDFKITGIYTAEDGTGVEFLVNYHTIKSKWFPLIVGLNND
jgi:hypothetical protein